jgi:hypothetical protein
MPILMTSGVAEAATNEHESLLSAYLRKPFRIEALMELVRRLLDNASSSA